MVNQDLKARLGGVFMVVAGALLGYLAIWRPYTQARLGAQVVSLHRSGIALAILFPLMGLLLLVGGESVAEHLKAQTSGKKTRLGWLYVVIIGAIALAVYLVVERRFEEMGYTI